MSKSKSEGFSDWKRKLATRKPTREITNRLLSVNEVIDRLGVCRTTLYKWRNNGKFPEGRKLAGSNLVKWSESTVDQWMKKEGF